MSKKIFRSMCLLILVSTLLFALLQGLLFNTQITNEFKKTFTAIRITFLNLEGTVLYDNYIESNSLDNHSNRPEIIEALREGSAFLERYSDTFQEDSFYYVVKANNFLIRIAFELKTVYSWIFAYLALTILCFLLSLIVSFIWARKLTKKLLHPLNSFVLDGTVELPYPELKPFVNKIQTQKNQISKQFKELQARTDTVTVITENMQEGMLIADKNGLVLSANKLVLDIFDVKKVVDKSILHICRAAEFIANAHEALAGKRNEMLLEHNNRTYRLMFSPVMVKDKVNAIIILFLDLSEKLHAETLRKEFSANVSHELKTPLTAISALAEMIATGVAKPEDIKDFATKINSQSKRLLTLINDIIRLSEFDEAQTEKQFVRIDISDLIQTTIDSLFPIAKEKNVSINFDAPSIYMNADMRMMDELIYNLLDNSIKYNEIGGSVFVSLSINAITSQEGLEESALVFSVHDTGIGIDSSHHARIFERFYRVDPSRSKKTGGTGLGLSIVKNIAELHGGSVEIQSAIGEGTTITCTFKM